jgi:type II secretory pathway component PulF
MASIILLNYDGKNEIVLNIIGIVTLIFSILWPLCVILLLNFMPVSDTQNDRPWWKVASRMIAWIIFGLLILGLLLFLFNTIGGTHFILLVGGIFFILLVVGIFRYLAMARYNQALEFVSTLAATMRQNLPLPTALQTAAIGRRDKTARIFRRTAHWLTQGYPLAEAVRKGYPRCLPEVISAIESAEKLSQLPEMLLSLEKDLVNHADETKKVRPVHPWYPVIVFIIISNLIMGLCIFIVPTFNAVLSDMSEGRTHLPLATQILLNLSNTMLRAPVILSIVGGIIVVIGWWLYYHFRTRIAYKPGPFLNLVDRIRWYWPLQRRLERNMSTLRLVEILRHSLSAGWPLNQSIAAALSVKMNICFKKRVRRWLQDIELGMDAAQSARARGIGSSVAWALDGKINPGQAPTLLEMLEETYRSKHNYIGNLIRSVMWPLAIVALGAFVGFVVYAMFAPMVQMITVCIENVTP